MCLLPRDILLSVQRPYRYVGGEVGSQKKGWDQCEVRICLVFPEVYEIGMSHLGLSLLSYVLNAEPGVLAERAFAPWQDMEEKLRAAGIPLFSLESQKPLSAFDVIGISLAYELTYTNALTILDLAGIPLRSADRDDSVPLVIAGGSCAFQPEPMAPFFDAIVIGDGEEVVRALAHEVRRAKREGIGRKKLLDRLQAIPGISIPSADAKEVKRASVHDLDAAPAPHAPIFPHAATQERIAVEVSRGCTRGCRFCQAGMITRPVRQRSQQGAVQLACDGIRSTGGTDFSFLSLSIGDWKPLERSLLSVHRELTPLAVQGSLPSLRVESLNQPIIDALGAKSSGSFTLAPEAATERMRACINKGNTDEELFASVERVFASGWGSIKLYFMLGLPGETDAEVEGIVRMANRCLDIGRRYHRRPNVTVSTSTFIPKSHTPFQWDAQISVSETLRLQQVLKRRLRRPGLAYRWHNAQMSFLEGVFSRGGRELADVIEAAWRLGARFDGWDECFQEDLWRKAFATCGIDPEQYLRARSQHEPLPWDHLQVGPSREFLLEERRRAESLIATEDCATGPCAACGVCDPRAGLMPRLAAAAEISRDELQGEATHVPGRPSDEAREMEIFSYRVRYHKQGRAAFLGHLEVVDALRRALGASQLPIVLTEGFHPRVKIAAGPALPVGVISRAEYVDLPLSKQVATEQIVERLQGRLPEGMQVMLAELLSEDAPSLEELVERVWYEIDLTGCSAAKRQHAREAFVARLPRPVLRKRKGKAVEVDVMESIAELVERKPNVLSLAVIHRAPPLKIFEIVQGLFGLSEEEVRGMTIVKIETAGPVK